MIDRSSPVPLYHQLAEQLTAAVEDGRLQPGDPFENELALAERLGLTPVVEIDDPRRDGPVRQVANPIRLSATPPSYRSAPPWLGEDAPAVSTRLSPAAEK